MWNMTIGVVTFSEDKDFYLLDVIFSRIVIRQWIVTRVTKFSLPQTSLSVKFKRCL